MAVAVIAMLWASCTKDDAKDNPPPIDPVATPSLLSVLHNSTDTTRWQYNADYTPKNSFYHYLDKSGTSVEEGGFIEHYNYENGKLTTVTGREWNGLTMLESFKIDYASDKILKLSSLL